MSSTDVVPNKENIELLACLFELAIEQVLNREH
jgi:hypothetical protein